jgi:hypothetical protein
MEHDEAGRRRSQQNCKARVVPRLLMKNERSPLSDFHIEFARRSINVTLPYDVLARWLVIAGLALAASGDSPLPFSGSAKRLCTVIGPPSPRDCPGRTGPLA